MTTTPKKMSLIGFANAVWYPGQPREEFKRLIKRRFPLGVQGRKPITNRRYGQLYRRIERKHEAAGK
jgi:hypothetical protein